MGDPKDPTWQTIYHTQPAQVESSTVARGASLAGKPLYRGGMGEYYYFLTRNEGTGLSLDFTAAETSSAPQVMDTFYTVSILDGALRLLLCLCVPGFAATVPAGSSAGRPWGKSRRKSGDPYGNGLGVTSWGAAGRRVLNPHDGGIPVEPPGALCGRQRELNEMQLVDDAGPSWNPHFLYNTLIP